jgi:hypothetical protein
MYPHRAYTTINDTKRLISCYRTDLSLSDTLPGQVQEQRELRFLEHVWATGNTGIDDSVSYPRRKYAVTD